MGFENERLGFLPLIDVAGDRVDVERRSEVEMIGPLY